MRKLLFFIFTLLTYSVIAQSYKEFDSQDYLKNGDYLYNNKTINRQEVLEILVNQKNKIYVLKYRLKMVILAFLFSWDLFQNILKNLLTQWLFPLHLPSPIMQIPEK